jgi:hypothetical protein
VFYPAKGQRFRLPGNLNLTIYHLFSRGIPAVNEKGERVLLFFGIIDILQT